MEDRTAFGVPEASDQADGAANQQRQGQKDPEGDDDTPSCHQIGLLAGGAHNGDNGAGQGDDCSGDGGPSPGPAGLLGAGGLSGDGHQG